MLTLLSSIAGLLRARAVESYLVGGCLRDLLLGRPTHDLDLAVAGDALALGRQLADALAAHFVPLDEERGIARVVVPQTADAIAWQVDLAAFDGDILSDLARRDFTIDAMAWPLRLCPEEAVNLAAVDLGADLIDPYDGRADLRRKLVRAVADDTFRADGLRLLRAIRLGAELDFELETRTVDLARRDASCLATAAPERQRDELMRILATPRGSPALREMDKLGMLERLLPELMAGKGFVQPKEHYYDVFDHCLEAVAALDSMLGPEPPPAPAAARLWRYLWGQLGWSPEASTHWNKRTADRHSRAALVKLAALLHDVAKPQTRTVDDTGRIRFFGHAEEGAKVASAIMRRLRFSGAAIQLITAMVTEHLRPPQMAQDGHPSRRALYRYFRDTGEAAIDILFLSLADHLATRGPRLDVEGWHAHVSLVNYILASREEKELVQPPRLITGHDLMRELKLEPGPLVGHLLAAIAEAQAAGEVSDIQTALALARRDLEQASAGKS